GDIIYSGTFRIGKGVHGLIDEVRIYNRALRAAQIEASYLAGLERLLAKDLIDEQEYQQRLLGFRD
ncbi:MAG: LamG domain-containing protein, partial [Candidatus Nealsonbacteria bacterium]|nr:LamG domain-containing protein [Candidatus Nealsonbacteria bacterium]